MGKLYKISIIHVIFCSFMMTFISNLIRDTDIYSIKHIFIIHAITTFIIFIYQRWINKKVLPYFGLNKHLYSILSLTLSYTIIGVIIARILIMLNSLSYIIKLGITLKSYENMNTGIFAIVIFYNIAIITVTAMTVNGLMDIKIKDIKKLRWDENEL